MTGITRLHGRDELRQIGPRVVRLYPLFHPAAALYTPGDAGDAARGLRADPGAAGDGRRPSSRSPRRRLR